MINFAGINQFNQNKYTAAINRRKVSFGSDFYFSNSELKASRCKYNDIKGMVELITDILLKEFHQEDAKDESRICDHRLTLEIKTLSEKSVPHVIKDKEGKILGSAVVGPLKPIPDYNINEDIAYISYVFLDKSIRGKGYGTAIIRHLIEDAKELKYKKILLSVKKCDPKAIHVYEKLDFKPLKKKGAEEINKYDPYIIGDGNIAMELDL